MVEMRVSADTKLKALGGAIAGEIEEGNEVRLSCIGSDALYNAIKGVCMAEYMTGRDTTLTIHPMVDESNRRRLFVDVSR